MNHIRTYSFILTVISIFALSFNTDAVAVETCDKWIAKAVSVQGEVHARTTDENQWTPVEMNNTFCTGDMLRVQEKSRAAIVLINDTIIRLDQNTTITFTQLEKKKTSVLDIIIGAVHFISRVPRTLKVSTPFVNGNVEGTEFLVRVFNDKTLMTVYEGRVLAVNDSGSLILSGSQSAIAESGKAPVLRTAVRPGDAVHWALYYPPVLNVRILDYSDAEMGWRAAVKESSRHYWNGDLASAFFSLQSVSAKVSDHQFYTYKAALFLTVGRVDDALKNINQALTIQPNDSTALALQSIIAVVHNESGKALTLANKAIDENPDSATAHIALSYAEQANFNLKASLKSLQKAVKLDPENALAWARLSELWQSFNDLDKAMDAANKSVSLNPDLARTQTVLGYSHLSQINTAKAIIKFEKAITLDQADPLPRLGLGLAQIREGKLTEGRENMEIAASLDPGNSLIRSYMGKAYYEEKRDKLAEDQFEMAQSLDPKDPTPFFYNAIRKQSINRPVEALHDLQKAIELNDNRAIYRSRLLLDEDLAARSASLARIYSDLGFQKLALVEGWKSVNIDPGNYSAHRFLADSYSVLPRHEIARVSELFQSQLLQPVNLTPVQPQLAASNLYILNGAGPGSLSFNEFNPIFNRNQTSFQVSTVAGDNNTYGHEAAVSGIYDRFSISAGQFLYTTEGFRENNDQEKTLNNVFTQISLSHKTSVQAEYRHTASETGDLELTFTEDVSVDLRQKEDIDTLRAGVYHSITPSSELLFSFIYKTLNIKSDVIPFFFNIKSDFNLYVGEIQYLFKSPPYHITAGIGHRELDQKEVATFAGFPSEEDLEAKSTTVYLYSNIKFPKNVSFTIGGSADFLDGRDEDHDQFNPKVGLTWSPFPATTIRAAIFRTLQQPLISQQDITPTLEPTQVASFNQFFFGSEGDRTWRYAIGMDQTLPKNIYSGGEFSVRNIETTFIVTASGSPVLIHRDWDEQMGRAYIYLTPVEWLALKAEYIYEKFTREKAGGFTGAEQFSELKTHRVPLEGNYYHACGLIAGIKATYIKQKGDFTVPDPDPMSTDFSIIQGDETFWVVDASVGYRLPKRHGLISIEFKNVFDEEFKFQDTDPANTRIVPDRLILLKFTMAL